MAEHNDTGKWGEDTAAGYLEKKGFIILERNYRYHHYEIDLIARKDRTLIFAEVKTRRWTAFGMPETFVNATKVKLIKRAAEHFIFASDWKYDVRFDIVSILTRPEGGFEIFHIEDAFY